MFLTKRKAEDRSPWGDFFFTPVGKLSMSGARVTPESALQLSAVYASVRVLSETIACLPINIYRTGDKNKKPAKDHWLWPLLTRRPNRYQNPFEFKEMLQGHLALRGNAYCLMQFDRQGRITELLPRHPDRVKIDLLDNGDYRFQIADQTGKWVPFAREEVWHLRGLSSDGIVGLSPMDIAREAVGLGLSAQSYGARFFQNDAKPTGGWIEFNGTFKDKTSREMFRESWQDAQAAMNRGRMAVLEHGMKYHEVGVTNDDAQFLETRKFQTEEIARIFRVPPHLIGDLSRSTFSNIEQQSIDFATYTMTPWAERWEASIEHQLLLDSDEIEVSFDFRRLLRGDAGARASYYHNGILDGWMTRAEAREAEDLPPIDGLDEPLRPLNMVEESAAEVGETTTGTDDDET
ncbi:phage portal protein [Chitinimonas sp.]|uniref:phage portal protein n=1 Tax=Chitinimonas sp. TaxID=1934313 RepID=UPI0035B331C4